MKYFITLICSTFVLVPAFAFAEVIDVHQDQKEQKKEIRDTDRGTKVENEAKKQQKAEEENASSTKESSEDATSTKSITTCTQEAIEKRDTAITASRQIYNQAMTQALTERKNSEKKAVAIKNEDDKKTAIKASVTSYKSATKTAQNTLTQARKEAWDTFQDDTDACHTLDDSNNQEEATAPTLLKTDEPKSETVRAKVKESEPEKSFIEVLKSLFN